jgi:hypothetical protein
MRKVTSALALAVVIAGISAPTVSNSQCIFDAPSKARQLKTSIVRTVAACPGVTHVAPNTSTGVSGTPACAPVVALSDYDFGPKGRCTMQLKSVRFEPCPFGSAPSCTNPELKLKCASILDPLGEPIDGDAAALWSLRLRLRMTFDDEGSGDMTTTDLTAVAIIPPGSRGKLRLSAPYNEAVGNAFLPCFDPVLGCALPGCTSLEIIGVRLYDPDQRPFGAIGSSTR